MLGKKDGAPSAHSHTDSYDRELQILYARRSAIDSLIQSLQNYGRFSAQQPDSEHERKLA